MSDQTTLPAEWLDNLRLRAEGGDPLCLHKHTVHRNDAEDEVWLTCDDPVETRELGRLNLGPRTSQDRSDDIRFFIQKTLDGHYLKVADDAVLTLLAALGR